MNNNLNFLCLLPSFHFPRPTNESKTKLKKTWKNQNTRKRVPYIQQMKPRQNYKKQDKKKKKQNIQKMKPRQNYKKRDQKKEETKHTKMSTTKSMAMLKLN